jgi:hypothetical protein
MRNLTLTVIIIATCFSSGAQSLGPKVVNSTGGSFTKGYYAIDWSVGELPIINQLSDYNHAYVITSGYIQAFTDLPHFSDTPRVFTNQEIRILPNPTRGNLEVNFLLHEKGQVTLTLYDALGGRLQTRTISVHGYGRFERVDMSGLPNSTYLLYIELKGSHGYQDRRGVYKISKIR